MSDFRDLLSQLQPLHADAYGWALACVGGADLESAREVLQDAYLKVAAGRAVYGGQSKLKTWWFGVVQRTAREHQRRGWRWLRLLEAVKNAFESSAPAEHEPPPRGCAPDELRAALAKLPRRQAEVLHLVFYQSLSLSEAAEVMGLSPGSARQHYHRAKDNLRARLAAARAKPAGDD